MALTEETSPSCRATPMLLPLCKLTSSKGLLRAGQREEEAKGFWMAANESRHRSPLCFLVLWLHPQRGGILLGWMGMGQDSALCWKRENVTWNVWFHLLMF